MSVIIGSCGQSKDDRDEERLRSGDDATAVLRYRIAEDLVGRRVDPLDVDEDARSFVLGWHNRMRARGAVEDAPLPPFAVRYDAIAKRLEIYDPTEKPGEKDRTEIA